MDAFGPQCGLRASIGHWVFLAVPATRTAQAPARAPSTASFSRSMGRRSGGHWHPTPTLYLFFWKKGLFDLYAICERGMEPMTNIRLSVVRWKAIQELARQEHRSATVQLGLIVDQGLGGRAGYEIARMRDEKVSRIMVDETSDGV